MVKSFEDKYPESVADAGESGLDRFFCQPVGSGDLSLSRSMEIERLDQFPFHGLKFAQANIQRRRQRRGPVIWRIGARVCRSLRNREVACLSTLLHPHLVDQGGACQTGKPAPKPIGVGARFHVADGAQQGVLQRLLREAVVAARRHQQVTVQARVVFLKELSKGRIVAAGDRSGQFEDGRTRLGRHGTGGVSEERIGRLAQSRFCDRRIGLGLGGGWRLRAQLVENLLNH